MTCVKTSLPTLKTRVVNLKRDAKDLSHDLQWLEVRGKLGSKTLYRCEISYRGEILASVQARTGVNSRRGDSHRHDILWWYHVNKYRAMRGIRRELAPGRKSPRCQ